MIILEKHIVPPGDYHIRLQEYAGTVFEKLQSRSAVKKAIAKNSLLINQQVAQTSNWIKAGQCIELIAHNTNPKKIFQLQLTVIFQDNDIAVINKPAGFPTNGNYYKTIENALPFNLTESQKSDALNFPKPVHRLDNPTSGILLIAKTKTAQIHLHKQFEAKSIKKEYHAVVVGSIQKKGVINTPVNSQEATTLFETVRQITALQNNYLSLVKLHPKTGRTHQLRIHLSELGHPIVGDKLYASNNIMMHKGLFLAATAIHFTHPINNKQCSYHIEIPSKFNNYLNREHKRTLKYSNQ